MKTLFLTILTLATLISPSVFADVSELTTPTQLVTQLKTDQPVVILFSASWCGACKLFHPTYEKVSKNMNAQFFTIDVDNPELRRVSSSIPAVPLVMVMQLHSQGTKGRMKVCEAIKGNAPAEAVQKAINQCLQKLK